MSAYGKSVQWNACVHRLDLGIYSHPKEFLGNGVRTHVNSKSCHALPHVSHDVEATESESDSGVLAYCHVISAPIHALQNTETSESKSNLRLQAYCVQYHSPRI